MTTIRVAIVDDHRVISQGLRSYLESFDDIEIIGTAESGEEALGQIETWQPDVVIMDMLLPGGIDGVESTRRLRISRPETQIVMLTAYTDQPRVLAALRAGAIGYVPKDAEPEVLLAAVRAAARGQSVLDPAIAGAVVQEAVSADARHKLTERELDVLRELALGRSNKEIANELFVGEATVKTHVANILEKLQLGQRAQATIYALKKGIVTLDEIAPDGQERSAG